MASSSARVPNAARPLPHGVTTACSDARRRKRDERTRTIGGQLETSRRGGELGAPVASNSLDTRVVSCVRCHDAKSGYWIGERRERVVVAAIERVEIAQHQTARRAVRRNVMREEQQHVLLGRDAHQRRAQQQILREIERRRRLFANDAVRVVRTVGSQLGQFDSARRPNDLHGSSPSLTNTVRKIACRSTSLSSARCSCATSSGPRTCIARGTLYADVPGADCSRRHNSSCANDSGTGSPSTPRGIDADDDTRARASRRRLLHERTLRRRQPIELSQQRVVARRARRRVSHELRTRLGWPSVIRRWTSASDNPSIDANAAASSR